MPIVILDGPEAAGKSTIIDALLSAWGISSMYRHWGPRESWLEYCHPLFEDLQRCERNPELLVVWSRCWASRTVYNKLLDQGQVIPPTVTKELDNIVIRSGGFLGMVVSSEKVLLERRLLRIESGDPKKDHQLDVSKELSEFQKYARGTRWNTLLGTEPVEDNVRNIVYILTIRNPECRMIQVPEVSMSG